MIVSVAEEMNPTRRNTMEDAHDVRKPGSWGAPNPRAAFLSVMDGHGGRLIADYLEDHLASNVASEWRHAASDVERRRGGGRRSSSSSPSATKTTTTTSTTTSTTTTTANDDDDVVVGPRSKRRRHAGDDGDGDGERSPTTTTTTATAETTTKETTSRSDVEVQGDVVRISLERAFLLTDVRSRLDGIATSGATVACCVVIPNYPPPDDEEGGGGGGGVVGDRRRRRRRGGGCRGPASISVHAANAGDARAVLSSDTAARRRRRRRSRGRDRGRSRSISGGGAEIVDEDDPTATEVVPPPPSSSSSSTWSRRRHPAAAAASSSAGRPPPRRRRTTHPAAAVRLTRDHKSTDPDEIARVEKSGGVVLRGRVLGVLAVARSLGDHGLKEYVIGRPHVSSAVVRIFDRSDDDEEDDDDDDGKDEDNDRENNGDGGDRDHDPSDDDDDGMAEEGGGGDAPHTDGEFLIVACDGLWDVMEDQEAVDLVRGRVRHRRDDDDDRLGGSETCDGREGVSSFLVEEALRRGSADNITVVVYWL